MNINNIIETFSSLNESEQEELLEELTLIHEGVNSKTIYMFTHKYPDARFLWYIFDSYDSIPLEKFKEYYELWKKYSKKIKSALCQHYDNVLYFRSTDEKFLISYSFRGDFITEKDNLDEYINYIMDNMNIGEIYLDGFLLRDLLKA